MKKNQHLVLLLAIIGCLLSSCGKEDEPDHYPDIPITFTSLEAARSTIFTEDTTKLTATASGYDLTYHWYVEKGDLLGSGNQITFVATPCTVGVNDITCTVIDGNDKQKTLHVYVTVL